MCPITPRQEIPVIFECAGEQLIGVVHETDMAANVGVLVVVGGPQYRVGSHRQFVLLTRHLAANGVPSMRFDARGMGDAQGEQRRFDEIEADIAAAIDCFFKQCPTLTGVILWGLCDGASATLFYAYQDSRVKGVVILNPWVYTQQGAAKTYLKHYYLQRLLSKDFWRKVFSFKFDYLSSIGSLLSLFKQAVGNDNEPGTANSVVKVDQQLALPIRMRECLRQFAFPVLLILSGRDLTANEFKETVKSDPQWQALLDDPRVTRQDFAEADHTFSTALWRDQVAEWTVVWAKQLAG
jgi:uncharacterized protein